MAIYLSSFRVGQISLQEGALSKYGEAGGRYIDLFVGALRQYGMLCIGLYRSQLNDPILLTKQNYSHKMFSNDSHPHFVGKFYFCKYSFMTNVNHYLFH